MLIGTSLASRSPFRNRLAALSPGDTVSARWLIYTYGSTFAIDQDAPRLVILIQGVDITPDPPGRHTLPHAPALPDEAAK